MDTTYTGDSEYDDGRYGLSLEEVLARLPHVHHLSIGSESEFFGSFYYGLKHALVSPAPSLEYLSLFCQEDEYWRTTAYYRHPDTLFSGSTPRLTSLKLRNCDISWNSLLFKGLKYLEILTPHKKARPTLAVWLDTLNEIPQLKTLTLHSASPIAVHFPIDDVERTVTLPSLTHLDISAALPDCALALSHLILPALTSLCLAEIDHLLPNGSVVQEFLPYIARHVHGPQDIRPLQSVLIRNCGSNLELLAWPVPDVDTFVHDPPAFLGATIPTRVKLSFKSMGDDRLEIFEKMMAALPLNGLLTLAAVDLELRDYSSSLSQFWLGLFPNWPLLRRVRLGGTIPSREFIKALLKDDWGCENPLLPSLTELVLAGISLDPHWDPHWTLCLRDTLIQRVEQGVPLKTLDLRMCDVDSYDPKAVQSLSVQLLSEIVVDILHPLDYLGPRQKMIAMWKPLDPYTYSDDDDSKGEDNDD
jgi:hypothetical protein